LWLLERGARARGSGLCLGTGFALVGWACLVVVAMFVSVRWRAVCWRGLWCLVSLWVEQLRRLRLRLELTEGWSWDCGGFVSIHVAAWFLFLLFVFLVYLFLSFGDANECRWSGQSQVRGTDLIGIQLHITLARRSGSHHITSQHSNPRYTKHTHTHTHTHMQEQPHESKNAFNLQ
jgi:hypothetical protein